MLVPSPGPVCRRPRFLMTCRTGALRACPAFLSGGLEGHAHLGLGLPDHAAVEFLAVVQQQVERIGYADDTGYAQPRPGFRQVADGALQRGEAAIGDDASALERPMADDGATLDR